MVDHNGLPVAGYQAQTDERVELVNGFKRDEERLLRVIESMMIATEENEFFKSLPAFDPRWLSIAMTHFQQGFMALNRSVFRPGRVKLPEDA